jgi:hypothetical protein
MFGIVTTEMILFAFIAIVIFVIPAATISYLVWRSIKRGK